MTWLVPKIIAPKCLILLFVMPTLVAVSVNFVKSTQNVLLKLVSARPLLTLTIVSIGMFNTSDSCNHKIHDFICMWQIRQFKLETSNIDVILPELTPTRAI